MGRAPPAQAPAADLWRVASGNPVSYAEARLSRSVISLIFKPLFLSPAVAMKHHRLCLFQVSLVLGCVLNSISSSFLRVGTLCLCVHGVSSDFSEHFSDFSGHGGLGQSCPVGGSLGGALFWGVSPRTAWETVPSVPVWTLALTHAEPVPPGPRRSGQASVHPPSAPADTSPGLELWVSALALCVGGFKAVPCC